MVGVAAMAYLLIVDARTLPRARQPQRQSSVKLVSARDGGPAPARVPAVVRRPGRIVLGDRMVGIALAFAVLDLGGSATELGLVLACRTFPLLARC